MYPLLAAWHTETGPPPVRIASQQAYRNATQRLGTEGDIVGLEGDSSVVLHRFNEMVDGGNDPAVVSGPEGDVEGRDQGRTASGPERVDALVQLSGRSETDQVCCVSHT